MTSPSEAGPFPGWRWLTLGAAVVAGVGGVLLYFVSPTEDGNYPSCPFHSWTGLHCPGCGTLRALHALLHGDFLQALAFNPLAMLCLPLLLAWAVRKGFAALVGRPWTEPTPPVRWIYALLAVVVAFWILRNIPVPPFDLLAPHLLR